MKIYNLALLLLLEIPHSCNQAIEFKHALPVQDSMKSQKKLLPATAGNILTSKDGGLTWQNMSEGLPQQLRDKYGVQRNNFFADDKAVYLTAGNELYEGKPNAAVPTWTKNSFPDAQGSIASGKNGVYAYNHNGLISQKLHGQREWSVLTHFKESELLTVFESAAGNVFIGTRKGLFRSGDAGQTWKQVQAAGWAMKIVESNGTLMATSVKGIIRSKDQGETWDLVISEGGVGIAVERIRDGFAAITYNTQSETRRIRTSYDGGNTWQAIDGGNTWQPFGSGLPPSPAISSIVQLGNDFYCGHPDGIFKSSDKGKTWKLVKPSIEKKVFNLSVSGNVIYAIPMSDGC